MKKHVMQYARFNLICLFLLSTTLAACGFQLRGVANLSFKSVFVQGSTLSISRELNQSFKTNGIQVVNSIEDAELLIEMLNETNEKRILSLSGGGVVREYELNYRVSFRTRDPASETWSAPQTVQARRDFSYNPKRDGESFAAANGVGEHEPASFDEEPQLLPLLVGQRKAASSVHKDHMLIE